MATTTIDVILQLRRDNDYNYKRVESTFIPLKGEMCLVDTSRNGLRAKVGDGVTAWKNLRYLDEDIAKNVIVRGYFSDGQFYSDAKLATLIEASVNKIYVDVAQNAMYVYDGSQYVSISQAATVAEATATAAGIMKLYDTLGENTDGTMTQRAITNELNEKVEANVDVDAELLTLTTN